MEDAPDRFRPPSAPLEPRRRLHTWRRLLVAIGVMAWLLFAHTLGTRLDIRFPGGLAGLLTALAACVIALVVRRWQRRRARARRES